MPLLPELTQHAAHMNHTQAQGIRNDRLGQADHVPTLQCRFADILYLTSRPVRFACSREIMLMNSRDNTGDWQNASITLVLL